MNISGRIIKSYLKRHHRRAQQGKEAPIDLQTQTLRQLLKKAANTELGRYYDFAGLLQADNLVKAYQQRVQLHTYQDMYDQWWHRLLKEEENIVWPGKTKYFALSSGTSGSSSKYIPVTDDMLQAMRKTSKFMLAHSTQLGLSNAFYGRQFLMVGSSTDLPKQGELTIGDVSGINTSRVPYWFRAFYKPGRQIAKMKNWEQRVQAMADQAPDWNISTIAGSPSWIQLLLERIIEHNQVEHIHEIWPNFQVYVSGGVAFGPYRKRFERMMGRPIIYLDTYYTSEGCLACQTRLDNEVMPVELVLHNGIFFEFIPFNDANFENGELKGNHEVLAIDEVEEGVDYAIVLTTCSGAWRYLLGDTIKFIDKEHSEIKITGRTKHFLSICGEHLSVDNMNAAVEAVEEQFDIAISEFTVKAIRVDAHFEHHWYLGINKSVDVTAFTKALDEQLCLLNDDYRTERQDNLLKNIVVHLLPEKIFSQWLIQYGKTGGQVKFPRVMNDQQFADWKAYLKAQELEIEK